MVDSRKLIVLLIIKGYYYLQEASSMHVNWLFYYEAEISYCNDGASSI